MVRLHSTFHLPSVISSLLLAITPDDEY